MRQQKGFGEGKRHSCANKKGKKKGCIIVASAIINVSAEAGESGV